MRVRAIRAAAMCAHYARVIQCVQACAAERVHRRAGTDIYRCGELSVTFSSKHFVILKICSNFAGEVRIFLCNDGGQP